MKNFEYCAYTYKHRKAIKYLINKLIKDQEVNYSHLRSFASLRWELPTSTRKVAK